MCVVVVVAAAAAAALVACALLLWLALGNPFQLSEACRFGAALWAVLSAPPEFAEDTLHTDLMVPAWGEYRTRLRVE